MKYLPIITLACLFMSFRDDPKTLVLREHVTLPHPEISLEVRGNQYFAPEITLLEIGTRDGRHRFFVRGARTPQDAAMMFRTIEPREYQFLRP